MSTWQDIEGHLDRVNTKDYGYDRETNGPDRKAREAIRRIVFDLERKADERDTLRAMLLEQGAENARLAVELEQAQVRRDARHCDSGGWSPGAQVAHNTGPGDEQVEPPARDEEDDRG